MLRLTQKPKQTEQACQGQRERPFCRALFLVRLISHFHAVGGLKE